MIDFATAAAQNRTRSRLLVGGMVALAAALGLVFDYAAGTLTRGVPWLSLIGVAGVVVSVWIATRAGDKLVLSALGARELNAADPEQQQLGNVVREMAVASGLPPPRVYVIEDDAPNALATGRDPAHASIAVTTGLLARLDRAETQGVIAHEMSHIGNRDTRLSVLVAVLLGAIALLADGAWRVRQSGSRHRERARKFGLLLPLVIAVSALAPAVSRLIAFAISRQREYLADASAVSLTRNPLALASALEAIAEQPRPTRTGMQGTAHLFFASPHASWADEHEGRMASWMATHPPITDRIARLRAMAGVRSAMRADAPSTPSAEA
jgi:heat shock protein HtpX